MDSSARTTQSTPARTSCEGAHPCRRFRSLSLCPLWRWPAGSAERNGTPMGQPRQLVKLFCNRAD